MNITETYTIPKHTLQYRDPRRHKESENKYTSTVQGQQLMFRSEYSVYDIQAVTQILCNVKRVLEVTQKFLRTYTPQVVHGSYVTRLTFPTSNTCSYRSSRTTERCCIGYILTRCCIKADLSPKLNVKASHDDEHEYSCLLECYVVLYGTD